MSTNHKKGALQQEAEQSRIVDGVNHIATSIIIPLLYSILGLVTQSLYANYGLLAALPWFFVVAIHVTFWFRTLPASGSVLKLVAENLELKELNSAARVELESAKTWVFQSLASLALRDMSVSFVQSGIDSTQQLKEALSDILAPLYLEPGNIFGISGSERWSFGVYLYSKRDDVLVPVWREKSRNHPSDGLGRKWGRGQGHVGKAFVDCKPIITGDASHPDVIQLCGAPPGKDQNYDTTAYLSFASIPIGPYGPDEMPYGVLVGTSDHKDRFDEDTGILLMHFADTIGTILALGDVRFDELELQTVNGGNDEH